jgi:hypothetical protein
MPCDYLSDNHLSQFGRYRIAAALPAAAAVTTSPRLQSEFCPLPSDSAGDVSVHLAKGAEKAAAALITDRPRDLLN